MKLINGFYQSKELATHEQFYYTAARQYLKDNGLRMFTNYIMAAAVQESPGMLITHQQFMDILWLALDDYHYIIFNPLTFKNDN